ncbi:MAG: hypothetical protein HPY50_11905 [Firmicutes bacterium]|nr:hypothetical protein [Bacillota bacterium]
MFLSSWRLSAQPSSISGAGSRLSINLGFKVFLKSNIILLTNEKSFMLIHPFSIRTTDSAGRFGSYLEFGILLPLLIVAEQYYFFLIKIGCGYEVILDMVLGLKVFLAALVAYFVYGELIRQGYVKRKELRIVILTAAAVIVFLILLNLYV